MASPWTLSKELICPQCGDVIGRATVRRLTGWLNVELAGGGVSAPSEGAVQLRIAEQRLHSATPGEQAEAQRRIEFIQREMGEQIYDLRCPRGHWTLITAPQIIRAMRRAGGDWARLG